MLRLQKEIECLRDIYQAQADRLAEDSDLPCVYTEYDRIEAKAEAFRKVLQEMDEGKDQPMWYLLLDISHASIQLSVHPTLDKAREEMKERIKGEIPWLPEALLQVSAYKDLQFEWDLSHGTIRTEDGKLARHWQIFCQRWNGQIR